MRNFQGNLPTGLLGNCTLYQGYTNYETMGTCGKKKKDQNRASVEVEIFVHAASGLSFP